MTIEYMAKQDCFKIKYTDAFTYVRAECKANVMEAAYAWLFGKTVKVSVGQQYMKNNRTTTLSKKLSVILESAAFKSRDIKQTTGKTVPLSGSLHLNDSDDRIREENQKIKKECVILEVERKKLKGEISSGNKELSQCRNAMDIAAQKNNSVDDRIKTIDCENEDLKTQLMKKKKNLDQVICRFKEITGMMPMGKETQENKMNVFMRDQLSALYDKEWKDLYDEIYEQNKQNNTNTDIYCTLLKIFKSGEVIAKNIIIKEKIKILTDNVESSERSDLWDKKTNKMKNDLINNEKDLLEYIDKSVEAEMDGNSGMKDGGYKSLNSYLQKIIIMRLLMAFEYVPMEFSHKCNNHGCENEFVRLNRNKLKTNDLVECVVLPAILDKDGCVVAKGIVYCQTDIIIGWGKHRHGIIL